MQSHLQPDTDHLKGLTVESSTGVWLGTSRKRLQSGSISSKSQKACPQELSSQPGSISKGSSRPWPKSTDSVATVKNSPSQDMPGVGGDDVKHIVVGPQGITAVTCNPVSSNWSVAGSAVETWFVPKRHEHILRGSVNEEPKGAFKLSRLDWNKDSRMCKANCRHCKAKWWTAWAWKVTLH